MTNLSLKMKFQNYLTMMCMRKSKNLTKPKSSVPGDLPRKIVKEFGPDLACPAGIIFRNIVKTGHWPKAWRIEYGTPLKKQRIN